MIAPANTQERRENLRPHLKVISNFVHPKLLALRLVTLAQVYSAPLEIWALAKSGPHPATCNCWWRGGQDKMFQTLPDN